MKANNNNYFVSAAFFVSLFCVGFFYEYLSCIAGAVFAVWLFINHIRKKQTVIYLNTAFLAVTVIVVLYGLSYFWAVDRGMAFIGFAKYLPLLLFALCYMQTSEKGAIIILMPYAAAVMTVLSLLLSLISPLKDYFFTDGRLGGFFRYPATFAVFLLVAQLLLITKTKIKYYDVITGILLVCGILCTGSKTVLAIGIIANAVAILSTKSKRFIFYSLLGAGGGCFALLVYCISTNSMHIITDFFNMSLIRSAVSERLLHIKDALPDILDNPFGLGYMGYHYTLPSFQSGIYSLTFIRNDFLQLMLDIGWIPCLTWFVALAVRLFSKKTGKKDRIILLAMTAHSLFDFDMQFLSVFFIYLVFLGLKDGKQITLTGGAKWAVSAVSAVLACVSVYMGTALVLYRAGNFEASHKLYPHNVNAQLMLIDQSDDMVYSNKIADEILEVNKYSLSAYSVKAQYSYSVGDFDSLIKYKNKIFEIAPFEYGEYEEYARMLINGISHYEEAGDKAKAEECRKELVSIPERLEKLTDRLSAEGKLLTEQPKTKLPDILAGYIDTLKNTEE